MRPLAAHPVRLAATQAHAADRGPWSPDALTRRAIADLDTMAGDMRRRQCEPREILDALHRQAELWRQYGATMLPADAALFAVRRAIGAPTWHPLDDWQESMRRRDQDALVQGIDPGEPGIDAERVEWRRRALVLSHWLAEYGGTATAESVVRAAERDLCSQLEACA